MAKTRDDAPKVSSFADHEVIVPPHRLNRALSMTGRDIGPDLDAIARAEAALAGLSEDFPAWMGAEGERLDAARRRVARGGLKDAARGELFRAAHDIKGHATTFGYPLAADAADSLCRLIEHSPVADRVPLALVDQHVDAIRAIIREGARDAGDAVGAALVARLREVTDAFLVAENRHRPDYLDGIVIGA